MRNWIITNWPLITQIVLGTLLLVCAWIYLPMAWGAPWLPASLRTVRKMLERAGVQPGQRVVDLGAGDGRIVIAAALWFKAEAVGIEIDPLRCAIANTLIRLLAIRDRARVQRGTLFEFDLTGADVVTLYLWPSTVQRLRSRLLKQLDNGAKVVSFKFPIYGWTPLDPGDHSTQGIFVYEIGRSEPDLW